MATQEGDGGEKGIFEQDPHVEQLRPEPSAPPSDVVILEGLAGKSDREGWGRLYFNRTLTYYAEFRREDIVFTEAIPPEQGPMVGLKATRVGIKKDAVIEYTRTTRATVQDEFDLDVRLGAAAPRQAAQPNIPNSNFDCPITIGIECPTQPFGCVTDQTCGCQTQQRTECFGRTCVGPCITDDTCRTDCDQATCATCRTCQTRCNQPTCRATCNTCQTRCNQPTCQATCNTCQTQCNQNTCQTCRTNCNQQTCDTCRTDCFGICPTNNPHVFTCGPRCVEP
jgi:hypothetical protein